MDSKQFNKPLPLFSHQEFVELQEKLRQIGSKPTDGDLVAALIHAALQDLEATKLAVENFVKHELALDHAEAAIESTPDEAEV
jgi:hypothetical protein